MTNEDFADYQIPPHMRGGILRYMNNRIKPGGFLMCILEGDIDGAHARADSTNRPLISEYSRFLYSRAPAHSYGDKKTVAKWLSEKPVPA